MGIREDILADIASLNAKLAILNGIDEDTFNFNTVAQISFANGQKIFLLKVGEERWQNIKTNIQKELNTWIFESTQGNLGYFEVYIMTAGEVPFYASA